MAELKFKEHKITGDGGLIKTAPTDVLQVKYPSGVEVHLGNELTPRAVKDEPTVQWNADGNKLYCLIMTDPDASPEYSEIKHWLVINIPGNNLEEGRVMAAYRGSGPPLGTGKHRYIFIVYEQAAKIESDEQPIPNTSREGRRNFKVQAFAEKHNLGSPVAGNFYLAEYDDYVGEMQKQMAAAASS
ncbi:putative Phosphatidylethanolamine-binding protein-like protein F40A3.3 [Hypsibius exemplaris]|uniref:Phosphatidylethanolamine-binding protein-like protein F40A3.3 n=1 Tax=Hypsibius exemplaris TaxID=2072580 RepID=A0A1W0XE20_HYPEX|nr:putative Phosphatidylethanolamine-binding protein-like protein F40A3.3 [Hypsibius exemplaris]